LLLDVCVNECVLGSERCVNAIELDVLQHPIKKNALDKLEIFRQAQKSEDVYANLH